MKRDLDVANGTVSIDVKEELGVIKDSLLALCKEAGKEYSDDMLINIFTSLMERGFLDRGGMDRMPPEIRNERLQIMVKRHFQDITRRDGKEASGQ